MAGRITKKWIAPVIGLAVVGGIFGLGFSSKMNVGGAPTCYTVGPVDSRQYQKPVCEDRSALTNVDTFAKMLNHFGVVLPEQADGLRFQVKDYSAWNTGTMLGLYLHFTTTAQNADALVRDLGAKPSTGAYEQGSPPDEMQFGDVWDMVAEYSTQSGLTPAYAKLHSYVWSRGSGGGGLIIDDSADPGNPSVFVTSSVDSY